MFAGVGAEEATVVTEISPQFIGPIKPVATVFGIDLSWGMILGGIAVVGLGYLYYTNAE